jgi:hypothetical protein
MHVYEVRPRKDKRGVDLISDALPFGRLWYGEPNAIRRVCFLGDGDLVKSVPTNPRLRSPAPEILDYLARQPKTQDTIDGILHWWLLDSCSRTWAPKIAKTVSELVKRGFLVEKASPDGKIFYRVSPR